MSETAVEDWVRDEGLPYIPDRGRLLFDRSQVATWAAARGLGAKVGFLAQENPVFGTGWQLEPLLRTGGIWRGVAASDVFKLIEQVVSTIPGVTPSVRTLLIQRVRSTGGVIWAPVGGGLGMPHLSARVALGRASGTLSLISLKEDLPLEEAPPDGIPLRHLFFFIAPSPRAHLDLLGRLSRVLSHGNLRERVLSGAADALIYESLTAADAAAGAAGKERA